MLKAQGIKGELKVLCALDEASMLKGIKQLYLNNVPRNVKSLRCDVNVFYVLFEGISDRNAAENYRDWDIFCDRESIILEDGRYFVDEIIGCRVTLDNGGSVGEVVDVLQYGAADVYVCEKDGREVSFPVLKDLVVSVDTHLKSIVLSANRFAEVAVTDEN